MVQTQYFEFEPRQRQPRSGHCVPFDDSFHTPLKNKYCTIVYLHAKWVRTRTLWADGKAEGHRHGQNCQRRPHHHLYRRRCHTFLQFPALIRPRLTIVYPRPYHPSLQGLCHSTSLWPFRLFFRARYCTFRPVRCDPCRLL